MVSLSKTATPARNTDVRAHGVMIQEVRHMDGFTRAMEHAQDMDTLARTNDLRGLSGFFQRGYILASDVS